MEPPAVVVREGAVVVTFGLPVEAIGKTTGKAIGKAIGKTPLAVFELLAGDPTLTVPQLAARLEKSELTIHRAIRTLRESGRLKRVGPDKGGYWKVIE